MSIIKKKKQKKPQMPPNPYQIGTIIVFTFNFILKFHLLFHSLPCKVAHTLQSRTNSCSRNSGEAFFWKARSICMYQGMTVNSVNLSRQIWKPPRRRLY